MENHNGFTDWFKSLYRGKLKKLELEKDFLQQLFISQGRNKMAYQFAHLTDKEMLEQISGEKINRVTRVGRVPYVDQKSGEIKKSRKIVGVTTSGKSVEFIAKGLLTKEHVQELEGKTEDLSEIWKKRERMEVIDPLE